MRVRSILQTVVFGMVLALGLASAQGETWDAYTGFLPGPTAQSSGNLWQYGYVDTPAHALANTGYTLFGSYANAGWGYDAWSLGAFTYAMVGKDPAVTTELRMHPVGGVSYIGWKNQSPSTQTVNVSYSITDRDFSNLGFDGVEAWLFRTGDSTALSHAVAANSGGPDGTSGTINVTNVAVASGDMLYFQLGGTGTTYADLTGVNFTITSVPEPGTLALLAIGLIGLLAYAWRKRK